jgi:flagellar hook-associated protein 1
MLGLFGTLNLAARSLATQQQGTEVAGHNLANVNNPAYSRQRLVIQTSNPVPGAIGPQGSGADAVAIQQLRDHLLDRQIQSELSARSSLDAQQKALQYAQAGLGQEIDQHGSATSESGAQTGLAGDLSRLFNSFHSLSSQPSSLAERQILLLNAQNLTTQFSQTAGRLDNVTSSLNDSVTSDVARANVALTDIAKLNASIVTAELSGRYQANDLRDLRQQRIEDLSEIAGVTTTSAPNGSIDISLDGVTLVQGSQILDQLESFTDPAGLTFVRSLANGTPLSLTSGSLHGTIEARDGAVASLRSNLDTLAAQLITEVNAVHASGFDLQDQSGLPFFTGTDASSIRVHGDLLADPSRIQAAANPNAPGDNQVILALAQLGDRTVAGLQNQLSPSNINRLSPASANP